MILFLTSSNQVKQCCKGQPSSFGLSVFLIIISKQGYRRFWDWYVCAAVAIPTVPWLKPEHPPQFPAYQTACGMFYYAVPERCRNLQFKSFPTINEQHVNSTTPGPRFDRNLIKYNNPDSSGLCLCWWPDVWCILGKGMNFTGLKSFTVLLSRKTAVSHLL